MTASYDCTDKHSKLIRRFHSLEALQQAYWNSALLSHLLTQSIDALTQTIQLCHDARNEPARKHYDTVRTMQRTVRQRYMRQMKECKRQLLGEDEDSGNDEKTERPIPPTPEFQT